MITKPSQTEAAKRLNPLEIITLIALLIQSLVNGFNQVVGFSGPALDSPKSRAFFWSKSTGMIDLGTLGGAYAQAFAINDSGSITGNSQLRSLRSSAIGTEAVHAPFPITLESRSDGDARPRHAGWQLQLRNGHQC